MLGLRTFLSAPPHFCPAPKLGKMWSGLCRTDAISEDFGTFSQTPNQKGHLENRFFQEIAEKCRAPQFRVYPPVVHDRLTRMRDCLSMVF